MPGQAEGETSGSGVEGGGAWGVNAGTEEEALELFDVFQNSNNVYGLVGSSDHVHYLGIQESGAACAFAAAHFYLSSGGSIQVTPPLAPLALPP